MIWSSKYWPWIFIIHLEPVSFQVNAFLRVWRLRYNVYIVLQKEWLDVVDFNFFNLCLQNILSVELNDLIQYFLELCFEVYVHVTIKNQIQKRTDKIL